MKDNKETLINADDYFCGRLICECVDGRTRERRCLQCYQPNKVKETITHSPVKHCVTCTRVFEGQVINCVDFRVVTGSSVIEVCAPNEVSVFLNSLQ